MRGLQWQQSGPDALVQWKRTKLSVQEALLLQKARVNNVKYLKITVPHRTGQSEHPLYDCYSPET